MKHAIHSFLFLCLLGCPLLAEGQGGELVRGSYESLGIVEVEDNSFFMEEAFNQGKGVIQNIFNVYLEDFDSGDITYSFSQELPIAGLGHQMNYSINYISIRPRDSASTGVSGFSDISISYRPLVWGPARWAMIIPRFTVILPTGKSADGLGTGGVGLQFNLAVTKRLSRTITSHYNIGVTRSLKEDYYTHANGEDRLLYERDITNKNLGISLVWHLRSKVNFLIEEIANHSGQIQDDGRVRYQWQHIVNPGIRFGFTINQTQIVPGVAVPVTLSSGEPALAGIFLYFSIEPAYGQH